MIDLYQYQDLKYKAFQEKIIASKYPLIGIRTPILRKLSKKIDQSELAQLPISYEKVLLEGMQISKTNDKEAFIDNYLPKIESWSVCDTFCCNLSFIKKDLGRYYNYLKNHLYSNEEFKIRFSVVVFLKYYINDIYINNILDELKKIKFHAYYSDMAIAWFLAEAYYMYPDLIEKNMSLFSANIQQIARKKIKESIKIKK